MNQPPGLAPETPSNGTSGATGVILAGGISRRMGRDKLPLMVGEKPLLDRVCLALASRCGEILVVGGGGDVPAEARCVPDLRPGRQGPLAGIEAGLLAARHRAVFVAAGDMPFLTGELAGYLLGLLSGDAPAVVPDSGGRLHPLCAVYGREVRPAVSAALDRRIRSVRELLEVLPGVRYVREEELRRFGNPDLLLTNVNSPEDLERARKALNGGEG
ncbi:MAG: molybdenum cofactor guanylyltransferase [Actinobacteria bacterium]|nr:molybdenum cofactor guanylyltransferase [Actinomycetota bacterium]